MSDTNVIKLAQPRTFTNSLTEILRGDILLYLSNGSRSQSFPSQLTRGRPRCGASFQ